MASSSSSSSPELSHSRQQNTRKVAPFKYANQADVLEDLSRFVDLAGRTSFYLTSRADSRFILNLPDEELASVERICMQVEQAYVANLYSLLIPPDAIL